MLTLSWLHVVLLGAGLLAIAMWCAEVSRQLSLMRTENAKLRQRFWLLVSHFNLRLDSEHTLPEKFVDSRPYKVALDPPTAAARRK